jgi:hypothetical protein
MGEQTSIPSDHQGSTEKIVDEHVFDRLGQARS